MSPVQKPQEGGGGMWERNTEQDEELDLGLGLSLGARRKQKQQPCRFLTAKDFPSMAVPSRVSPTTSSASSSSFPSLVGSENHSPPSSGQVVGWPPIMRSHRMNNLFNQYKDSSSSHQGKKPINTLVAGNGNGKEEGKKPSEKKKPKSKFVKVNMDGMGIGRKVDLSVHHSYQTLALLLDEMFHNPSSSSPSSISTSTTTFKPPFQTKNTKTSNLLYGSSEFVLTYEDKDGDWMLLGDVPWSMFLSSVRRLRIMRTSYSCFHGVAVAASKEPKRK